MSHRRYRTVTQNGKIHVQYLFWGLIWYTAHTHDSLLDAEFRIEGDQIIRQYLETRRALEKKAWRYVKEETKRLKDMKRNSANG